MNDKQAPATDDASRGGYRDPAPRPDDGTDAEYQRLLRAGDARRVLQRRGRWALAILGLLAVPAVAWAIFQASRSEARAPLPRRPENVVCKQSVICGSCSGFSPITVMRCVSPMAPAPRAEDFPDSVCDFSASPQCR